MFDLFPEMPQAAKFFVAFMIVLGLIGVTAWLVRRFGGNRLGSASRGRQPRLAVIDAASVDGRRRLVLIRRDNIEHLLMIGGPNDLIIEPNIVRAVAAREPGRVGPAAVPFAEAATTWPLQPAAELMPPVPARPSRAGLTEEPWVAAELPPVPREPAPRENRPRDPGPRELPARELRARPADSLTGMGTAEFTSKLSADLEAARSAPPPVIPPRETAAVPQAGSAPQTDHNLAEMAQRLEAALRRPRSSDIHPPVTDPLAAPVAASPELMRAPPVRNFKAEPKPEIRSEPKPTKRAFDSLEQEMVSLLGRQSGKS